MIRAYHAARGEAAQRDEIVTTAFSHPSNAACAKTAGYQGHHPHAGPGPGPSFTGRARSVLSERTAALLITNPEDTGIYNPEIDEFVRAVHEVGGLAAYDQANANGILGITRARDAGFDLCHFNLHKTFSTPHACGGPGAGACGVTEALAPFLPGPHRGARRRPVLPRRRAAPEHRQGPAVVWRRRQHRPRLRMDHEHGRGGPARGGRGRRPQQQLPAGAGPGHPRRGGALCRGPAEDRAGPLQLGGAGRRDGHPQRGAGGPDGRLRRRTTGPATTPSWYRSR